MKVGDLVTSADAPDGAPDWMGVVARTAWPDAPDRRALTLGGDNHTSWNPPREWRHLTDAEAIALVEALTWGWWSLMQGGPGRYLVKPHQGGAVITCWSNGMWHAGWDDGCALQGVAQGKEATVRDAQGVASRAILAHMCGGGR